MYGCGKRAKKMKRTLSEIGYTISNLYIISFIIRWRQGGHDYTIPSQLRLRHSKPQ